MMTREEAIDIIENKIQIDVRLCTKKEVEQYIEALTMACSALRPVSREQVEKVWKGEWQVCFEDWRKQMAGDQCSKCGFQHYGTSINHYKFCPACGAPMTDEAVQMAMERLEALKDDSTSD